MSYVIEVHSCEGGRIVGSGRGTCEGKASLQHEASIMPALLRVATERTWYRAYIIHNTSRVVCVVARKDGKLYRVGHVDDCTIGDTLPYLQSTTKVASTQGAVHYWRVSERVAWMEAQFRVPGVATAVALHMGSVHYAWERDATGSIELMANGRRDASVLHKTH